MFNFNYPSEMFDAIEFHMYDYAWVFEFANTSFELFQAWLVFVKCITF